MRVRAAALLLPLLVACTGGQRVVVPPAQVVREAAVHTAAAGTARLEVTLDAPLGTMTGTGVTSLREVESTLTMTLKPKVGDNALGVEYRLIGDAVYGRDLPGKPWIRLPVERPYPFRAVNLGTLAQIRQGDTTETLAYLQGASEDMRKTGTETLRGARTTRYEGTIDLARARELATDPGARDAITVVMAELANVVVPATVWVDDEGRMRKLVQTFGSFRSSVPGPVTATYELYDFGIPVDVVAPTAWKTLSPS